MIEERNSLVYDRYVVPVGLHYYGVTENLSKRKGYINTSFQFYIDEYGWDNISTTIVTDGLTKQEALKLEDELIKEGWLRGDCINKERSGGNRKVEYVKEHYNDIIEYKKQYYQCHKEKIKERHKQYYQNNKEKLRNMYEQYRKTHSEERKQHFKQWRSTTEGKIYVRVTNYNRLHPDCKLITPLEAKEMYLLTGYIPNFIKNDDLI